MLPEEGVSSSHPAAADAESAASAALADGDRDRALEILMNAYGDAVYRYCRSMLRDPERAKDVLQKTFVQAYESFGGFERRSSLRTWLYAIARHRCLDEAKAWRRWTRRATAVEDLALSDLPDTGEGTPEHGMLNEQWRRALARCLSQLAPRVRNAVVQRFVEGLSYAQMAEINGDEVGALRSRVCRALPALRRCVEGAGMRL